MIELLNPQRMKVYRMILLALAIIASANLSAQNATKAELEALTQRVARLETDLGRVITENVNLVEQLNIKKVTSMTDNKNGITFDIVKVEPNANTNDVVISLRMTNNSGAVKTITTDNTQWLAYDSDSNKADNSYKAWDRIEKKLEHGIPVNATVTFKNVPTTCSYLSLINGAYGVSTAGIFDKFTLKFTGVHIPW